MPNTQTNPLFDPESEESQRYFMENFNTPLTQEMEQQFQYWVGDLSRRMGRNVAMDLYNYDMRGFWLAQKTGNASIDPETLHFPDTFKKPNHPTFSAESIYNGTPSPYGKKFQGGIWDPKGKWFMPSKEMLGLTHPKPYMERYFKEREKGIELRFPGAL